LAVTSVNGRVETPKAQVWKDLLANGGVVSAKTKQEENKRAQLKVLIGGGGKGPSTQKKVRKEKINKTM